MVTTPPNPTTDNTIPSFETNLTERLVIVSNREPYTIKENQNEITLEKTPGGLVSALDPVLRKTNGLWICWEGATQRIEEFGETFSLENINELLEIDLPYAIKVVSLTESEVNHYYYGYANTVLWPLFHYFPGSCNFSDERDWPNYESANRKFAEVVLKETTDEDLIWVQDYQLFLVPGFIRQQGKSRKIGFFCHIPFPNYEIFRLLPKRKEIIRALLGSDLIGFHSPSYVQYFLECTEKLMPSGEAKVDWENHSIRYGDRNVYVKAFPISIDYHYLQTVAQKQEVQQKAQALKDSLSVEFVGIGVDRLDYSKGILERLEAIAVFFERYPEYQQRLTFFQIASPTRTQVPRYKALKDQVDQTVGRINGQLAKEGWTPIQYFYRGFSLKELLPYFRVADFALITPLRDGMNLVAKEFCAARGDTHGVLILSELTGAADELKEALQVNPYSVNALVDAIHQAITMSVEEQERRMQALRSTISNNDVQFWLKSYLESFKNVIHAKSEPKFESP